MTDYEIELYNSAMERLKKLNVKDDIISIVVQLEREIRQYRGKIMMLEDKLKAEEAKDDETIIRIKSGHKIMSVNMYFDDDNEDEAEG